MYKVVYNAKHGGFGLSEKGLREYNKRTLKTLSRYDYIPRDDSILIELVETMGSTINDRYSMLRIEEFPIKYKLFLQWGDYDGKESVIINYDKYLIYHIKYVKNNKLLTSDEKIKMIDNLYSEYDSRPKNILDISEEKELEASFLLSDAK
jgi:hypothetical protein